MSFENNIPEWKNEGAEPSAELQANGFAEGYKPPATIFNWFWSLVGKAIRELQTLFSSHAENKENPHGVTAAQVGLDKVNNTADSEKNVAFASESATSRKVKYGLIVRFKGGRTEGTDQWTYDGSTSRSVNITASNIGAADEIHAHTMDDLTDSATRKIPRLVTAYSTDGVAYTATVEGVTELYTGLEITVIPNMTSTSTQTTLDVNGLGAKNIRMTLPFNSGNSGALPTITGFMGAEAPITLRYHAKMNCWKTDMQRQSAHALYGTVPVDGGGTGAETAEGALENLGAFPKAGGDLNGDINLLQGSHYFIYDALGNLIQVLGLDNDEVKIGREDQGKNIYLANAIHLNNTHSFGTSLPSSAPLGRIFFKKV